MNEATTWSVRHVAEHAYCPRLFYFMEVEGVFLPSSDTELGKRIHRRVDRPSEAMSEDAEEPKSIRSLALTSETLGISGTLDLVEFDGNIAVPVEYRKGRPRHVSLEAPEQVVEDLEEPPLVTAEPWPTDRVQVGLQALLLMEAGYHVPRAVLYYASEKRRLDLPVDEALLREARDVLEAAKRTAQGTRPLPLVNDPKCPRCSLVSYCLPEETHYEQAQGKIPSPRRIWPSRDDGSHVVALTDGFRIGIRHQTLRVIDRDGNVVQEIPLAGVDSLSVLGNVQISTQALHALASRNVPIAFLSSAGRMVAFVDPLDSVNVAVRRAQVYGFDDPERRLELARALVSAKIRNQRTLLMRNHPNLPKEIADALREEATRAATARTLDQLRGHEGQAAALYFDAFPGMFSGPCAEQFRENGRQRRPPPDPINSCLSMAYSVLTNECVAALRTARLEPSIGALHSASRAGRPALALDLMEPFRPLIADSLTVSAFNRGELTEGHFFQTASGCRLTDHGFRAFFKAYARRMDTEITHPAYGYRLSYRRMILLHARLIAAWLIGEVPTLSFLTTR